jgi:hypothetical protein
MASSSGSDVQLHSFFGRVSSSLEGLKRLRVACDDCQFGLWIHATPAEDPSPSFHLESWMVEMLGALQAEIEFEAYTTDGESP